jgi:hypothetical protein
MNAEERKHAMVAIVQKMKTRLSAKKDIRAICEQNAILLMEISTKEFLILNDLNALILL